MSECGRRLLNFFVKEKRMIEDFPKRAASAPLLCRDSFRKKRWLLFVCIWLLAGPLACGESAGPGEEPTGASAGPFEAEVQGALQATLRGEATARLDSSGRLTGLEFDDASDTTRAGLSFELAAKPPAGPPAATRTYTVAPRQRAPGDTASVALMNAYLRLRGYAFAARAGSLRVSRDSTGLHGVFDLRLRGVIDAASDEPATVTARGRFDGVHPARQ